MLSEYSNGARRSRKLGEADMDGGRRHQNQNGYGTFKLVHVVPDEIPLYEPNRKVILIFNNPLPKNVNLNVCFMGLHTRRAFQITPRVLNEYTIEVRGIEHTTPEEAKLSIRTSPDNSVLCTYHRPFTFLSRLNLVEKLIEDESDAIDFLCTAFRLEKKTLSKLDGELTRRFCNSRPADYQLLKDADCNGNYGAGPDRQQTLVHFAAQCNFVELLRTLLQCPGATRLLKSENHVGLTPAELARQNDHFNLAKYLDKVVEEGVYIGMGKENACLFDKVEGESLRDGYVRMNNQDALNRDGGYVEMNIQGHSGTSPVPPNTLSPEQAAHLGKRSPTFGVIDDRYSGYSHPPSQSPDRQKSATFGAIIDDRNPYDYLAPSGPGHKGRPVSSADVDGFRSRHEYTSQSSQELENEPLYRSLPNQSEENRTAPFARSSSVGQSAPKKGSRVERLKEITDKTEKQRPPPLQPRRSSTFIESESEDFPSTSPIPQNRPRLSLATSPDGMAGHMSSGDVYSQLPSPVHGHEDRHSMISTSSSSSYSSHGSTTEDRQGAAPPPCPVVDYPRKKPTLARQRASLTAPLPRAGTESHTSDNEENVYGNLGESHPEDQGIYDSVRQKEEVVDDNLYQRVGAGNTLRRSTAPDIFNRPPVKPPPMTRKPMPPVPRRISAPVIKK